MLHIDFPAIMDNRMSGKDYKEDDMIQVSFPATVWFHLILSVLSQPNIGLEYLHPSIC